MTSKKRASCKLVAIELSRTSDKNTPLDTLDQQLTFLEGQAQAQRMNATLKVELLCSIRTLWPLCRIALITKGFLPKGSDVELMALPKKTACELLDLEAHLIEIIKRSLESEGESTRRLGSDGRSN